MKNIIERNLPLNTKYILTDKKYIPLLNGTGCTCDNCNKLIANIATVKNEVGKSFNIGFDCLETVLINNSLLSSSDILEYEKAKVMIPKILRFSKYIKDVLSKNINVTVILFEKQTYESEYFTFYWLLYKQSNGRSNDYVKLKNMNFDFLLETLKNIFPKLDILVK